MPTTLIIDGLTQMIADLADLPTALGREGTPIVVEHATSANRQITAAYPRRTGELRGAMSMTVTITQGRASAVVTNSSYYARMFEFGTVARHTKIGADRGAMPAGHVFLPIYNRENKLSLAELSAMVESHGLRVTNDAT